MSAHDEREVALSELAARQHDVVALRQIAALGMSPGSVAHRVRQGRLSREHQGVYVVGRQRLTPAGRRLAAVLACGDGAAASHVDAGGALDLGTAGRRVVHVTVPAGNHASSRPGIRVFRGRPLPETEVVVIDGCRVTSVARTLVDLGDVVRAEQVRRAFIRAEQLRVVNMLEIDASLARAGSRRGARVLRELLAVYDPRWHRTRSVLEIAMLDLVERFELPAPEVNEWLLGRYLVDFLWRERRLVVETDGNEVHGTATARRDDARRDHALRRAGFRVLRVPYRSVTDDPAAVANGVNAALAERTGKPSSGGFDQ